MQKKPKRGSKNFETQTVPIAAVISGICTSLFVNLGLVLFLSIFFLNRKSPLPGWTQLGSNYLSIMWGSFITSKRMRTRGWLWGGITGVFFLVLIAQLGKTFADFSTTGTVFFRSLGVAFLVGAIGGILGVNASR